jgi:hypothetical protein
MIEPISLSQEEQVRFMRALYAVFNRDGNINSLERAVLNSLGQTFGLNQFEYEHFIELTCQNLANEIASIRDIRIRGYFLAIIDDVYNNQFKLPFSAKSDGFLNLNLCLKERLMPKLQIL